MTDEIRYNDNGKTIIDTDEIIRDKFMGYLHSQMTDMEIYIIADAAEQVKEAINLFDNYLSIDEFIFAERAYDAFDKYIKDNNMLILNDEDNDYTIDTERNVLIDNNTSNVYEINVVEKYDTRF